MALFPLGPDNDSAIKAQGRENAVLVSSSLWGGGALPRQTPLTVCCALVTSAARSGPPAPSHAPGSVCASSGWGGGLSWLLGGGGRATQHHRTPAPAQARAPTLPAGSSLEVPRPGSAHPLKSRTLDSLYTPQTQNDRLPLRAPTSHGWGVQKHYPHDKWGSI